MTWRYGIVKTAEGYSVQEIYYKGKKCQRVWGYCDPPACFESRAELIKNLKWMLKDARCYPVYHPRTKREKAE